MLALLWLVYFCFGLTSSSIPPLVKPITQDLGISYGQMGLILGVWQLVFIGAAYPFGTLIDRMGVRRSLGVGVLVIMLSMVGRGLAVDFKTLLSAVAIFGLSAPFVSICAPKLVAEWFQGEERGRASGIYATASVAGAAFGLATAGGFVVPLTGNWRGIGPVYGAIVLVIALAWWILARDAPPPEEPRTRADDRDSGGPRQVARELMSIGNVRLIVLTAVGVFLINHGINAWMPALLQERGMSLGQAGVAAALTMGFGAFGVLLVPSIARPGYRALTAAILLVATTTTTLGLTRTAGAGLVGTLLASASVRRPTVSVLMLILMETPGVGARRMGSAAGLYFTAGQIGGFAGPVLLGLLLDATGSLAMGTLVLGAVSSAVLFAMPFLRGRGSVLPADPSTTSDEE